VWLRGEIQRAIAFCYRAWFERHLSPTNIYMGDAELMAAAFLLDIALITLGPVRQVYSDPATQFDFFTFEENRGPRPLRVMRLLFTIAGSARSRGGKSPPEHTAAR